jgi:hypothetical protein
MAEDDFGRRGFLTNIVGELQTPLNAANGSQLVIKFAGMVMRMS